MKVEGILSNSFFEANIILWNQFRMDGNTESEGQKNPSSLSCRLQVLHLTNAKVTGTLTFKASPIEGHTLNLTLIE